MIVGWNCKVMGVKGDGVCSPFSSGGRDIACVAAVVVHGWANIPGYNAMLCPCAPLFWCFKDQGFYTRWRKWGGIKVEFSMEVSIGGEMGM